MPRYPSNAHGDPRFYFLLPTAPTGVTGAPGNAQVSLTWTAPTSAAAITDYVIQYSSDSGSTWTTFADGQSTATSATVTGLTNNTAYVFRVAAISGIGIGAWSANSASVTAGFPGGISTNLAIWLDASDTATLFDATSGGALVSVDGGVARWEDKSGNGRHFTQSTSANRPQRKTNQIGGLEALAFDGTNDVLTRSNEAWAFTYPITVFCVFRATTFAAPYNALWDFYTDSATTTAGHTGLIKSNGKSAIYSTATDNTQPFYDGTGSATYSTATNYLFTAVIKNNSITSRQNKTSDGSSTGSWTLRNNRASTAFQIGASVTFTRYTQWRIGEFIVYNTAELSTQDRDSVETYLTDKWGT